LENPSSFPFLPLPTYFRFLFLFFFFFFFFFFFILGIYVAIFLFLFSFFLFFSSPLSSRNCAFLHSLLSCEWCWWFPSLHITCEPLSCSSELGRISLLLPRFCDLNGTEDKTKDEQLYCATLEGNLDKVKSLCSDPAVNVNWQNEDGTSALYRACQNGYHLIVEHLLARPKIDPNLAKHTEATPILIACDNGHKEVVSVMLADQRVDPNKPKKTLSTPLWFACQNGHLVVVQLLLASGREINTKMVSTFNNTTAAEQGRSMATRKTKPENETEEVFQRKKTNGPKCADLVDEYEKDPSGVRTRLRRELGPPGSFIFQFLFRSSFHSSVLIHRLHLLDLKKSRPAPTPEKKSAFLEQLRGKKRGKVTGMMSINRNLDSLINSSDCPNILCSRPADRMSSLPPRNQRSQNPPLSSLLLPQMP